MVPFGFFLYVAVGEKRMISSGDLSGESITKLIG